MLLQSPSRAAGSVEHLLHQVGGQIKGIFSFFRVPPQDAEDLLQDALLALVTKVSDVQSPDLWLLQTLRNRCASYWRSRRRWIFEEIDLALKAESDAGGDDPIGRQALRSDLQHAIARLPERCKSLLRLRYGLGCQTSEMADRLGYREGSVRKAEVRCISALTREIVGSDQSRT